jgi:hypothetical protein
MGGSFGVGRAGTAAVAAVLLAACTASPAVDHPTARPTPPATRPPTPPMTFLGRNPPDIYYIVLDDYGGPRALREQLGFDQEPFYGALRARGFFVPEHSTANYPRTELSLASSQNLDFVQDLVPHPPSDQHDTSPLLHLLAHPEMARFLHAHGYRYVHVGSWYAPTRTAPAADVEVRLPSPLPDVAAELGVPYPEPEPGDRLGTFLWQRREYLRVLYEFDELPRLRTPGHPMFVFAHVLCPHEPYSFDAKGRFIPFSERAHDDQGASYVRQVRFVDARILRLVDELTDVPVERRPVIVLQSDEGFYAALPGASAHPRPLIAQRHFGVFAAYLFPNVSSTRLYDTITPVNLFRLLFDDYFGAGLALLPDRNYVFPNVHRLYTFTDVTEQIRAES